jgi:hypothetical protein
VTDGTAALDDAPRDRYTLERELGRGGMARVYLARAEAVRLTAEVAEALAYAHQLGIVDAISPPEPELPSPLQQWLDP